MSKLIKMPILTGGLGKTCIGEKFEELATKVASVTGSNVEKVEIETLPDYASKYIQEVENYLQRYIKGDNDRMYNDSFGYPENDDMLVMIESDQIACIAEIETQAKRLFRNVNHYHFWNV